MVAVFVIEPSSVEEDEEEVEEDGEDRDKLGSSIYKRTASIPGKALYIGNIRNSYICKNVDKERFVIVVWATRTNVPLPVLA